MVSDPDQSRLQDAGLIAAANRVEHYGTAVLWFGAKFCHDTRMQQAVALLDATLNEERKADEKLTPLAESKVNQEASRAAAISR